jgi:hypothetical protein
MVTDEADSVLAIFDSRGYVWGRSQGRKITGIGGGERELRRRGPEAPGEVMIGGRVQIPMDVTDHVPVIEAKVNGKGPFRFHVDSGFGGMMQVSHALAEKLALPVLGERQKCLCHTRPSCSTDTSVCAPWGGRLATPARVKLRSGRSSLELGRLPPDRERMTEPAPLTHSLTQVCRMRM